MYCSFAPKLDLSCAQVYLSCTQFCLLVRLLRCISAFSFPHLSPSLYFLFSPFSVYSPTTFAHTRHLLPPHLSPSFLLASFQFCTHSPTCTSQKKFRLQLLLYSHGVWSLHGPPGAGKAPCPSHPGGTG